MGKNEHNLTNLLIEWLLIPIFLFSVWIFLSAAYLTEYINKEDYSFTVLSENHPYVSTAKNPSKNEITGEFTAGENYLGVLLLRFDITKTSPNTTLIFKIKEKGSQKWLHQSKTNSQHIRYLPLFPFGFPVIDKSQGKTYIYSVSTAKQRSTERLIISDEKPVVVTKYQFPKSLLLSNNTFLMYFLQQKALYIITNSYFILATLVYLLPFVLYVVLILILPENVLPKSLQRIIRHYTSIYKHKSKPLFFLMLSILGSIFFVPFRNDILYGILIFLWFYFIRKHTISHLFPFILSLGFMGLSFILLILQLDTIAEKSSIWAIIFLIIGVAMYSIRMIKGSRTARV